MHESISWAPRPFPSTHWSMVALVGNDRGGKREALEQLLLRYLPALKAHLVFRMRLSQDQAEDVLQSFVTEKVLEREFIQKADRSRGKFRTFLLTALDRFAIDCWRRDQVRKERSSAGAAIDIYEHEAPSPTRDGDVFDVAWAREVLGHVLRRMHSDCEESGRSDIWGVFEGRVLAPALQGKAPVSYQEMASRYAIQSPLKAANMLTTAKRTFRRCLYEAVREYVHSEKDVEAEILDLRRILLHAVQIESA